MAHKSPVPQRLLDRARSLRRDQSTPESVLWSLVRDRGLLDLKFRRQHRVGPFITDFYCDDLRWVIEVDGGQHNTADARSYDRRRSDYLAAEGITVTRFWSSEVMDEVEGVVDRMVEIAQELAARSTPSPLPPGEAGDPAAARSTPSPLPPGEAGRAAADSPTPSPLPPGEAGRRPGEGADEAVRIPCTLTPALSRREREEEKAALSRREREEEKPASGQREPEED